MGRALEIRGDLLSPAGLRRLARREGNRRTATRMLAVAHALAGRSWAEVARLVGLERQAFRDAVVRYNAEGSERPAGPAQARTTLSTQRGRADGTSEYHPVRP